mmetsp:Transcript_3008/g.6561  ORF Transcript_3008/g.6561 Transcript_3008/m.6561 type:complete len:95 (+) Transcript_3008:1145-1429(+)
MGFDDDFSIASAKSPGASATAVAEDGAVIVFVVVRAVLETIAVDSRVLDPNRAAIMGGATTADAEASSPLWTDMDRESAVMKNIVNRLWPLLRR